MLKLCRINPNLQSDHVWRDDLEFYIPQICNYFVFHEELNNQQLKDFLKESGKISYFFAHNLFFYLRSISQTIEKQKIQDLILVWDVLEEFYTIFSQHFYCQQLNTNHIIKQLQINKVNIFDEKTQLQQQQQEQNLYGSMQTEEEQSLNFKQIKMQNYIEQDIFGITNDNLKKEYMKDGFISTICFFNDIIEISNILKDADPKIISLIHELTKINQQLPANIYIPFLKKSIRNHVVLNIVTSECKVFSSKERSPYYICLEIFRPEELFDLSSEQTYIEEKNKNGITQQIKWLYDYILSLPITLETGDNIKQEQFAIQLIQQFHQIFKMEDLNIKLTPYEIVSMGPTSGIIEMIKDSVTLADLKKNIYTYYKEISDLNNFFEVFYGDDLKKAQKNLISSLVGYSLVCYFLQIKDRHNGNILLHKEGHIIHIDFGFFLSNAPGKGIAFEQNVPFKLLSEYIQIFGGVESKLFQKFRKLFFKGFQAACKHQDKILILVKMLYSGHGTTLPCFQKGELCIQELVQRFNPPNVTNDGDLSIHCNMLINQSLDNWRARWYDKWQYFCQGIFY
ncbi:phosphatidylinositol 4-kinase, putative [Ichthyophthirius multifiliis]|uniref:1-phosphatidylinositol 4-kinase n=1 Tax=Ichthyophthirius multifiliis TaxID=5932 RepID=G0R500_ICHMU|nr:phosphatidylinositol 4-kinase, putative [Ichthyophthirius multifiliis]EGR27463.1 phosphatidylinositol 4-kinase, putative [Ichthyophthirius multifiliis]|eukprot:XP_004024373.1 phosphatidylinositol 4-kinase, putative [Ichthyophthirius multifiliis]